MTKYFITAAGTGVGKTYITASLIRDLCARGQTVTGLKPIISGFKPAAAQESDTGILLQAQSLELSEQNIQAISPWRFCDPISPDMAAENEKRTIDFAELVAFCQRDRKTDYTIIEGAGGVMSPITPHHTVLNWIAALDHKIILVSGSYLGALSHTLTAVHTMLARRLPLHAVIVSESENSPVPPERILLTLKHFLPNDLYVHLVKRGADIETLASNLI